MASSPVWSMGAQEAGSGEGHPLPSGSRLPHQACLQANCREHQAGLSSVPIPGPVVSFSFWSALQMGPNPARPWSAPQVKPIFIFLSVCGMLFKTKALILTVQGR